MKRVKRNWALLAAGVGVALVSFWGLRTWNKHDFCKGWAEQYAARADEFRASAADPALSKNESREYLIAAEVHDLVSRKYAAVARRPWRPYPGYPLVTPEEQSIVAGKH